MEPSLQMSPLVREALLFATKAHEEAEPGGQKRWSGEDYIVHPIAVMNGLPFGSSEAMQCIALLHDVVEDTKVTSEEILEKFGETIAHGVGLLTKKKGQSYLDYLLIIKEFEDIASVKISDIKQNSSDLAKYNKPDKLEKYKMAIYILEN